MKKSILSVLFIVCCAFAFAQEPTWLTYQNEEFEFKYPSTWKEEPLNEEYSDAKLRIMIMSPEEGSKDKFVENVNILGQKVEDPLPMKKYADAMPEALKEVVQKFKLKSSVLKTNVNGEYACLEYTGEINGMKLAWMQCLFIKNLNVYALTFTAAQASYKKYKPIFTEIVNSFVIKN